MEVLKCLLGKLLQQIGQPANCLALAKTLTNFYFLALLVNFQRMDEPMCSGVSQNTHAMNDEKDDYLIVVVTWAVGAVVAALIIWRLVKNYKKDQKTGIANVSFDSNNVIKFRKHLN